MWLLRAVTIFQKATESRHRVFKILICNIGMYKLLDTIPCWSTHRIRWLYIKFIYSEKATKFCEISTLLLSNVVPVKSKVEVAFSEYINFTVFPCLVS